ncbi:hypothetical protein SETIT_2G252200v2 [Setaria italica]|uniref:Uncharacterized protein n=1 Tax=Setaria italica TaxID=4555 RepID=A0A368Q4Q5_SETIT|nr:hypothetical protein SETIT_2G252200v2 [Setaria italica]
MEMLSVAEAAARKAHIDHSTTTVTILYSKKDTPSVEEPIGSGFIIKLDEGWSKVMTCEHVVRVLHDMVGKYHLWVRYFYGDEDALATVKYENEFTNLALLDAL